MNTNTLKEILDKSLDGVIVGAEVTVAERNEYVGLIVYHEPTLTHEVSWINVGSGGVGSKTNSEWNTILEDTANQWIRIIQDKSN